MLKPTPQGVTVLVVAVSGCRRVEHRVVVSADGSFEAQLRLSEGLWSVVVTFEEVPRYKPCQAPATLEVLVAFSANIVLAAALAFGLAASFIVLRKRRLRRPSST